ncbi:unnamed protein product [Chrysoparadoxa australica]
MHRAQAILQEAMVKRSKLEEQVEVAVSVSEKLKLEVTAAAEEERVQADALLDQGMELVSTSGLEGLGLANEAVDALAVAAVTLGDSNWQAVVSAVKAGGDVGRVLTEVEAAPQPEPEPSSEKEAVKEKTVEGNVDSQKGEKEDVVPIPERFLDAPAIETDRGKMAREKLAEAEKNLENLRESLSAETTEVKHFSEGYEAYLPLKGSCFRKAAASYEYEVCPFGSAKQIEGGSATSLGAWAGFVESAADGLLDAPEAMTFNGGKRCWQGKSRSARVELRCGMKDELVEVTEPETCSYLMKLSTPAACYPEIALQPTVPAEAEIPEIPQGEREHVVGPTGELLSPTQDEL